MPARRRPRLCKMQISYFCKAQAGHDGCMPPEAVPWGGGGRRCPAGCLTDGGCQLVIWCLRTASASGDQFGEVEPAVNRCGTLHAARTWGEGGGEDSLCIVNASSQISAHALAHCHGWRTVLPLACDCAGSCMAQQVGSPSLPMPLRHTVCRRPRSGAGLRRCAAQSAGRDEDPAGRRKASPTRLLTCQRAS